MSRLALIVALFLSTVASAQPMAAQMSGIPRPDPQVPAGTVTVRLIRGQLPNNITDHEVELLGDGGALQKQKTDAAGRATFTGVPTGGSFVARAKEGEVELTSQPIVIPSDMGVRVMLVFPGPGAGAGTGPAAPTTDGLGRPDKSVPPGTILVHAQDGDGKPLGDLDVRLGHARAGESKATEQKARTNAAGDARFEGQDSKPTSGYLVEVLRDGVTYAGKPFRLVENMGSKVVLEIRAVTAEVSALQIGRGSHFIFEISDDSLQVAEVWRLSNGGTQPVDAKGGIHLPLPREAVGTQVGPESPQSFRVTGHEAVWSGPLPVGDTELQVMYVLPYSGGELTVRQSTPVAFSELNVITERIPGLVAEGPFTNHEDRELQGRNLVLYRAPGSPAGGVIEFTLTGLPHSNPQWRLLSAVIALGLFLGFLFWGLSGHSAAKRQIVELEAEREKLMAQLAEVEAKLHAKPGAKDEKAEKKRAQRRQELVDRLAVVYQELYEAEG